MRNDQLIPYPHNKASISQTEKTLPEKVKVQVRYPAPQSGNAHTLPDSPVHPSLTPSTTTSLMTFLPLTQGTLATEHFW